MTQTAHQKRPSPGILPNAGYKLARMPAGNPNDGDVLVVDDASGSIIVLAWSAPTGGGGGGAWGGITGTLSDQTDLKAALDTKLESGDLLGYATESYVDSSIAAIDLSGFATDAELASHVGNTSNPHSVTAAQVGAIGGSTGATDNAILRADGTGGAAAQGSLATIDDSGYLRSDRVNFGANSWVRSRTLSTSGDSLVFGLGGADRIYLNNDGLFAGMTSQFTTSLSTRQLCGSFAITDTIFGRTLGVKHSTLAGIVIACAAGQSYFVDSNSSSQLKIGSLAANAITIESDGKIAFASLVSKVPLTVATLPTAATNAGKEAQVTDSTVVASGNYGATVSGGGSNRVKVFSNGANWVIA